MATPNMSLSPDAEVTPEFIRRWPYSVGAVLSMLFLGEGWVSVPANSWAHVFAAVISMTVILFLPGTFLIGIVFPEGVAISGLGYVGLSSLASLILALSCGYVLSLGHVLDSQRIFIVLGSLSCVLVVAAWLVRREKLWLCQYKAQFRDSSPFALRWDWVRLLLLLLALGAFITSIVVSAASDRTVYPSFYLSNVAGQLTGYPAQLQRGVDRHLILHINNRGGGSNLITVKETDNGRLLWSQVRRIEMGQSWRHVVSLPTVQVGTNRVVVTVTPRRGVAVRLNVTYQVRT